MRTSDKITFGDEIKSQGLFKKESQPFYLFLVPKSDSSPTVALLNIKLVYGEDIQEFPFTVGTWNPTIVEALDVKEKDLSDFRIFYGAE